MAGLFCAQWAASAVSSIKAKRIFEQMPPQVLIETQSRMAMDFRFWNARGQLLQRIAWS